MKFSFVVLLLAIRCRSSLHWVRSPFSVDTELHLSTIIHIFMLKIIHILKSVRKIKNHFFRIQIFHPSFKLQYHEHYWALLSILNRDSFSWQQDATSKRNDFCAEVFIADVICEMIFVGFFHSANCVTKNKLLNFQRPCFDGEKRKTNNNNLIIHFWHRSHELRKHEKRKIEDERGENSKNGCKKIVTVN